eukprot:Trichotokara_eunicae@DN7927_c0_g1_i1.p1
MGLGSSKEIFTTEKEIKILEALTSNRNLPQSDERWLNLLSLEIPGNELTPHEIDELLTEKVWAQMIANNCTTGNVHGLLYFFVKLIKSFRSTPPEMTPPVSASSFLSQVYLVRSLLRCLASMPLPLVLLHCETIGDNTEEKEENENNKNEKKRNKRKKKKKKKKYSALI